MSGQNNFDAIAWINSYFSESSPLNFNQLRPVLCFPLLWNLFETQACTLNAHAESIKKSVKFASEAGRLEETKYKNYLTFFKNLCPDVDYPADWFFDYLVLKNDESKKAVRRALSEKDWDPNVHIYALLLIAHRIRNNMFHGNKTLASLPEQIDLFDTVNHLLATYLEDIKGLPENPS